MNSRNIATKAILNRLFATVLTLFAFIPSVMGHDMFRVLDNRMGLPDNTVNCIAQDHEGFIWMGTWNGLCLYDGFTFISFRHNPADPSSIIDNNIHRTLVTRFGVYAVTGKGLEYYSFAEGRFFRCTTGKGHPFKSSMHDIIRSGNRIFATDEHGRLYIKTNSPTEFSLLPHKLQIQSVSALPDGRLFGAGKKGVCLLSADGKKMLYHLPLGQLVTNWKFRTFYSKTARMVFVSCGIGHTTYAFTVTGNTIHATSTDIPSGVMQVADYKGKTIFAIDGKGLAIMNNGRIKYITPYNSNIGSDAVYSVFEDKQGKLWVGTYRSGVSIFTGQNQWFSVLNTANKKLTYKIVTAIVPDGDRIYIGLDGGGLNIYDRRTETTRSLTASNSQLPGNNIISMVKDKNDLYMAVYSKGVVRMSLSTGQMKLFRMPAYTSPDANYVWTLCDDGTGHLWIGSNDVYIMDKASGKISCVESLRGKGCATIVCHGKFIYIGNTYGIYKFDRTTRRIVAHYTTKTKGMSLPSNDVRQLFVDSRDNVWFSVNPGAGLFMMDERSCRIQKYDSANGLTSENIMSMVEDNDHNLWLGTSEGLYRFSPYSTHTFMRFDNEMDVSSYFTYDCAVKSGGDVFMGTTDGLVCLDPSKAVRRQSYSGVSFLTLQLLDETGKVFNLYGLNTRKINLDYNQNFFTVRYAVPEMDTPGRVQFACMLKGFEHSWREMGNGRTVSYTNVPPGEYTLCLICTDSRGIWTQPSELQITISPPWYATSWALSLWIILIVGAVVAAAWLYKHVTDIQHRIRISEIESKTQRELNETKLNFYTNITHELRTPVFLIAAQIEELLNVRKSVIPVPAAYLAAIHRNAAKLNRLISRVIDFRKMDSGKLKLTLVHKDVIDFCRSLTEDYENLCAQKNISFTFRHTRETVMLDFDEEKMECIISNLVSNAFKYTKEGGHVELKVEESPDKVIFSVSDDGIGIIEKMRDTIFESFFRTERATKQSGGDGLGLSFVKSLVELHEGSIRVDSKVNVGSTFTFDIPKKLGERTDGRNGNQSSSGASQSDSSSMDIASPDGNRYADSDLQRVQTPLSSLTATERTADASTVTDGGNGYVAAVDNPAAIHSILVIDDEHETVDLLERNLSEDFKVYKAYDGKEGIEAARRYLPDIIVCDIMMPKMNGLEFLSMLKADKKMQHIKVIIFTAKTSEEDMLKAFENGADAYLLKPLSLKVLRKRIDRLIAQTDNASLANSITDNRRTYNKEEQIFLLRCREVIDDNLSNNDFNIDFLADKLAMSHSSLYKKIKAMTGMSLIEFINDYKIYKSVQCFKQGMSNVDTVCFRCGFRDVKNFREMFKRKMKMTPKQYVLSLDQRTDNN